MGETNFIRFVRVSCELFCVCGLMSDFPGKTRPGTVLVVRVEIEEGDRREKRWC